MNSKRAGVAREAPATTSAVADAPTHALVDAGPRATIADAAAPSVATLSRWFQALVELQRQATASPELITAAVQALVEPGGMDAAAWATRHADRWKIDDRYTVAPFAPVAFDLQLAEAACEHAQTVSRTVDAPNLSGPITYLASPVRDETQRITGVLMGARCQSQSNRRRSIRSLEANWIELVAAALTTGIVRTHHEDESQRRRVLLEQAFPRDIVERMLVTGATMLPAERRHITILFADLFQSSRLNETLAPEIVYTLLTQLMELMTRVVQAEGGVIVDYYGDGLVAMWNAPLDQTAHAELACRAALEIQLELAELNRRWSAQIGEPLRLGIGVHTGEALVGNSGCHERMKYGPRGLAVHLACRIERATRQWPYAILMSAATRRELPVAAVTERLGTVELKGIERPVELFALLSLPPLPRV